MKYLIYILLLICNIGVAWSKQADVLPRDNKYILILNSYVYSDVWTTQIAKDIRKELESKDDKLIVNICYADIGTRNSYVSDRFGMQGAFSGARISQSMVVPSLLILIGDEGWSLYRNMDLRGKWENIPVVLCGVHNQIMGDYINFYRYRNFADSLMIPIDSSLKKNSATGVIINDNVSPTLRGISKLMPDLERLYYLSDRSYQDEYILHMIRRVIEREHHIAQLKVLYVDSDNTDSIKQILVDDNRTKSALLINTVDSDPKVDIPTFVLTDSHIDGQSVVGGYMDIADSLCKKVTSLTFDILYKGIDPTTIPLSYTSSSAYVFNKKALENYSMTQRAQEIANVIYVNLPLPFFIENFRAIMISAICLLILLFLAILSWRSYKHRKSLVGSYEQYKGLFDEYKVVYDNMPVGLALFNEHGDMISCNHSSEQFFGEFSSASPVSVISLNDVKQFKSPNFDTSYQDVKDEISDQDHTLMLTIDRSNVVRENEDKQRVLDTIRFALESSGWGVAQYNIITYEGFATRSWYDNLCQNKSIGTFETAYQYVEKEYRDRIYDFFEKVRSGSEETFMDTIQVNHNGKIHWLRYVVKVLRHAPQDGQIQVVELIINIKEQKECERELATALKKAQESYLLKRAFVANTGYEIRDTLDKINDNIDNLLWAVDIQEQERCANHISADNNTLLQILSLIIDMSRYESENSEHI